MSPAKTVASHRREEPQPDRVVDRTGPRPPRREADKRGNKRVVRGEKSWSPLKVKLPEFHARTLSKKKKKKAATREDNTPSWWTLEPAENRAASRVGGSPRAADADAVDGDVFFFSQRPSGKASDEKEQAKVSVLRTISRMLEENQRIRQRLLALTQAH